MSSRGVSGPPMQDCSPTHRKGPQMTDDAGDLVVSGTIITANVIEMPPAFPRSLTVGGVSIVLNANGSWSGDGDAFLKAVAAHKMSYHGADDLVIWMVANAIRNNTL